MNRMSPILGNDNRMRMLKKIHFAYRLTDSNNMTVE